MTDIKYCQSCIERGYKPPIPIATREWVTGIFYCDDCFNAVLDNLTNIAPAEVTKHSEVLPKTIEQGPVLDALYRAYGMPPELQFDRVDAVCKYRDKLWNHHAPTILNRTLEDLAQEIEQLGMAYFHIKYRIEPLDRRVQELKAQRRQEKNLIGYEDSKEEYAKGDKPKKSAATSTKKEKVAKSLGMSPEALAAMLAQGEVINKKKKEREFNILAGNCAECGEHADVLVKEKGEDIPYCHKHGAEAAVGA